MPNIVELILDSVKPSDLTEDDKTTYIGFKDMIDLDAPVVVASGNISVSPPFFRTLSVINTTVTSRKLA